MPVPTIAPLQIRRASSTLASAIGSGAQVGRPATSSRPSRSKSMSDLLQRRGLAAAFGGEVEVALELDRGEAVARQVSGLEAGVGAQHEFVAFDQRAAAGGRRAGDALSARIAAEERAASPQPAKWHGEVSGDWRRLPSVKIRFAVDLQPAAGALGFGVADLPAAALRRCAPNWASARVAAP